MAGIITENQIYEVGIYCRLSKDDGTENESASIATQKSILTDYVKKQGWHLAKTYVDDGYSGTNFQRPSFQNMIKDIENGLINCVITKDLSRLGRNYLDCGLYLEVFFPEHNVRYIAVNDGVDTLNKSAMDITPFRNILNEMYAADISVKIKSAYRARFQQGKFMATYAPYGYIKDPADHNHLLIDDRVAHVIREIFDLALAGNGIEKIRKHLNKQHILCPAAFSVSQGETGYERHFEGDEDRRYFWSNNSVRNILRSPVYAGNLVGYRRVAVSMKSKKKLYRLPEEWEVIPNTHEGIVTQAEFDTVQQLMTSRRREQNAGGFKNIFAGVIKCADCGYAMRAMSANRRKRPDIIDCVQYNCNNYGKYGNTICTAHSVEARDLFNAVLADINRFADMAVNDEKAVRAIEKRLTETDQSRAKTLEKEQKKLNKRLAELDRLFSSLYEDKVMERITERNFEMMSGKYQKEQLEIEARLKDVTETLNESYEKTQGIRDFLSLIRNYQGLKELDATVVNALIDKIFVSEREKMADGTVQQKIKICYKFIGFVDELHITPTKRWTALPAKHCTVCGVEYVPGSAISKYCPVCARKVKLERANESRRRSREQKRMACIEPSAKNDRLDLNKSMDGMTSEEKSNIISNIFNKTDLSSVNALLANTGDTWDDLQASIVNSGGAAQQMADTQLDNLQGQLTILKSALEGLAISFGELLMPAIKQIVGWVQKFVDWLNGMDEGTKKVVVTVALFAAALGPVLIIVGKVISAVGTIMTVVPKIAGVINTVKRAFAALNATMLANPIFLIIAAITALVAAFIYLWNTNEDFRQFWIDLWENIKEVAIAVWNTIKEFFAAAWEGIKSVAETVWNGLRDFFTGLWEGIKNIFTTVVTAISTFLFTVWNTIKTVVTTVFTAIQTFFTTVWNAISTVVKTVVIAIQTFLTTAWNVIKTAITTVLTAIQTVVTTVWNAISTFITTIVTAIQTFLTTAWNTIKMVITTVLNAIKTVFTTIWNAIKSVITTVVNGIKNNITTVWNNIKSTVSSVVNGIKTAVSNAFSAMWNGIKNTISGIYNTIKGGFDNAVNYIKNLASSAFNWGKDLVMGIVNGIKSCIGAVGDAVSSVADKIRSFLHFSVPDEGPLTDYETWMPDFMRGLAKGIEKSKVMVAKAMDGVAADMVVNPKISAADTSGMLGGTSAGDTLAGITTAITDALSGISGQGGDIVIPVYLGGTMLDEVVVNAQQRTNLRSGGR